MVNTETRDNSIKKKKTSLLKSEIFSLKMIQFRPVFLVLFLLGLMVIFYLAILNPDIIFSIITGLALFAAGFLISNLFYLKASGKKEDECNRMIVNHSSDLFLIFNVSDGRFKHVSPSIQKLLGYDLTAVLNAYDLSFVHPADRFELYNVLDKNFLRLNRNFTTTLRMIKRDGSVCWIKLKGDVLVDASNELDKVIMNLREVTNEKERSIAQQQYVKSLEQSIQKNNSKTHEYEEIANLMSSYDLKEPLRTIASYSQLVQHRYGNVLDEDGNNFLRQTVESSNRMARMMDDILSFSNVRIEKFKPRNISSEKAIKEVEHVLSRQLKSLDAQVIYENLPEVKVDFVQFKQLLKNLLENAMKYRGAKPPIIEVSAMSQNDSFLFKVKDNGIGISKSHQESIFDVFRKIKGMGKSDGTGLGLAVCKKIVSNHGGKIWVESEGAGKGSTFFFTIPKADEEDISNNTITKESNFQTELTFKKLKLHI